LIESDIDVALSLCDVCPASDATGVAGVLLNCFESRTKVLVFLKAIIDREVFSTGKKKKKHVAHNGSMFCITLFFCLCRTRGYFV
jgi:neurofibromin 1